MNYSVMYTSKDDPEGRVQIVTALAAHLAQETDLQNILRASITLGNLCHENEEIKGLLHALGAKWPDMSKVVAVAGEADTEANKKTIAEIRDMLMEVEE